MQKARTKKTDIESVFLRRSAEIVNQRKDSNLFHEYLGADHEPLFFYQFIEQLKEADLDYLSDAYLSHTLVEQAGLEEDIVDQINNTSDRIAKEQYLDILKNRKSRRSLIIHKNQPLDDTLSGDTLLRKMEKLYFSGSLKEDRKRFSRPHCLQKPFATGGTVPDCVR